MTTMRFSILRHFSNHRSLSSGALLLTALVIACGPAPANPAKAQAIASPDMQSSLAAARAAGTCEIDQKSVADGVVRGSSLLDAMAGFALTSATTGGMGRPLLTVTSTGTDPRDPTTLPGAVRAATRNGGGWIVFDLPADQRTIKLERVLTLPSNVTLDGGCSGVTVTNDGPQSILRVDQPNVIVTRLTLRQDQTVSGEGDCLTVRNAADRIWVAYNDFRKCGDGQLDITQGPNQPNATRVTVAYNRFSDHVSSMLIATLECNARNHADWCDRPFERAWDWSSGVQATLQGNLFDGTAQRHPRLSGRVYAHMVDNVVAFEGEMRPNGRRGASYGVLVGVGARLYADNNLFIALDPQGSNRAIYSAETPGAESLDEGPGSAFVRGAVLEGGAIADARRSDMTPVPPYNLTPHADFADRAVAVACAGKRAGVNGLGAVCN